MNLESLTIREPSTKTEFWYEWLNFRIRHYFILEIVFFFLLGFLVSNSYNISSQNVETYELIWQLHFKIDKLEKRLDSMKESTQDIREESVTETTTPVQHEIETTTENYPEIEKATESTTTTSTKTSSSHSVLSIPSDSLFNAASFVRGASVSPSNAAGYVILDRPNPPRSMAWCSMDKQPILTIKLSNYIKPVYVSYQHSKWYGVVPIRAPKTYDVMACFDQDCHTKKPLVFNCQYISDNEEQEQKCMIPTDIDLPAIKYVRFRFHEKYGNTNDTCIVLVRVFGEFRDTPIDEKKVEENAKTCKGLATSYYHSPIIYTLKDKNCSMLYKMECCDECPECCSECLIDDWTFGRIAICITLFLIPCLLLCCCSIYCHEENGRRRL